MKLWIIQQEERTRTATVWAVVGERKSKTALEAVQAQYPDSKVVDKGRGLFSVSYKAQSPIPVCCREKGKR